MEKEIGTFLRNGGTNQIRVFLQDFKGKLYINTRVFAFKDNEFVRTPKGITLHLEETMQVIPLLEEALKKADKIMS
ncbi:MAG: hypothetical protein GY861_28190 [bacterium]|nr:hypothetical protein [bacterium]